MAITRQYIKFAIACILFEIFSTSSRLNTFIFAFSIIILYLKVVFSWGGGKFGIGVLQVYVGALICWLSELLCGNVDDLGYFLVSIHLVVSPAYGDWEFYS